MKACNKGCLNIEEAYMPCILFSWWDFRFSQWKVWKLQPSGIQHCVVSPKETNISQVRTAYIIIALMMEAVCTSETLVFFKISGCYIPEGCNLQFYYCFVPQKCGSSHQITSYTIRCNARHKIFIKLFWCHQVPASTPPPLPEYTTVKIYQFVTALIYDVECVVWSSVIQKFTSVHKLRISITAIPDHVSGIMLRKTTQLSKLLMASP
jgi:hypothetical protein